jgi:hypothetical protein
MKNKSKGKLDSIYVYILLALVFGLSFAKCSTEFLPGMSGVVLDKDTKKPISDAYVICFDDRYPLLDIINVGGAYGDATAMQLVKTDKNGRFKLKPYFNVSLPSDDLRFIVIYKSGYYGECLYHKGIFRTRLCSDDYDSTNFNLFSNSYLIKKYPPNNYIEDYEINRAIAALNVTRTFAEQFSWHDKNKFKKYKPLFTEIYQILNNDSDLIHSRLSKNYKVKTTPQYAIDSWERTLRDLGSMVNR